MTSNPKPPQPIIFPTAVHRTADLIIEPKPKLFPSRFNVVLDQSEHTALDELFDLHPQLDDEVALLHEVIRKGIGVMLQQSEDRDPHQPKRSQLQTTASPATQVLPRLPKFQRSAVEYLATKHGEDPESMLRLVVSRGVLGFLQATVLGESREALDAARHRCIFGYIATPVSERLAQRLEDILAANPDLDEETVWERLLRLGAEQAEHHPEAMHSESVRDDEESESRALKNARAMVRHAERCVARAKRACER